MSRRRFARAAVIILCTAFVIQGRGEVRAHEGPHGEKGNPGSRAIELNEKIGGKIAGEALFSNENGIQLKLESIIKKPTLILPIYYTCKSSCSIMLGNLARAVNDVPLALGKEYGIIALSFDSDDSPATARTARENHLAALKTPPLPAHGISYPDGMKRSPNSPAPSDSASSRAEPGSSCIPIPWW